MIGIGNKIPDFEVDAVVKGEMTRIKLSDYHGKWMVFIFYPSDFSFVCPTELEDAAKLYEDFRKEGAEVFSVSRDSKYAHKAWHDSSPSIGKIEYPMIADPSGKMCDAFGTCVEGEGVSFRGTFLVDPDGMVKAMEMNDNSIGRNIGETLRKLRAAIYVRKNPGEVCPVNWKPGEKTLKPGDDLVGKL
jgi:peroxiredoxin (alkyl hydroperoxide reductase subunit C)